MLMASYDLTHSLRHETWKACKCSYIPHLLRHVQAECPARAELKHLACREKDKKKKKGGDADAESGGDSPGSPGEDGAADGEGDVVWMTDTSEQAAKDRAQAQLTKAMADMVTQVSASLG